MASAIRQANVLAEEVTNDELEDEDNDNRVETFNIVMVWKASTVSYDQNRMERLFDIALVTNYQEIRTVPD